MSMGERLGRSGEGEKSSYLYKNTSNRTPSELKVSRFYEWGNEVSLSST